MHARDVVGARSPLAAGPEPARDVFDVVDRPATSADVAQAGVRCEPRHARAHDGRREVEGVGVDAAVGDDVDEAVPEGQALGDGGAVEGRLPVQIGKDGGSGLDAATIPATDRRRRRRRRCRRRRRRGAGCGEGPGRSSFSHRAVVAGRGGRSRDGAAFDAVRTVDDDGAAMPPKPAPPSPDDERRKDAAAEADRLGREHSNKREMKARADRLRTAGDEPRPPRAATGVPGAPGAPVLQPQPRRAESRPEIRLPESDPPAPREPREQREVREVRPPTPVTARVERPPREERPRDERPREERRERPRQPREEVYDRQHGGVIDEVAVEAEEFIRDYSGLWRRFNVADKITVVSALLTLFGSFLPWLWRAREEVVIGLGCGGVVHAVIACASMALLVRRDRPSLDERGLRPTPARQRQLARRTALWLLLLSLMSTVAGTWFLLVYGAVRRFEVPTLEVGVGLYVALAAGLGLSYSGFAFFWRTNRDGKDGRPR